MPKPPAPHNPWLALTPKGALYAFSQPSPNQEQLALQTLLSEDTLLPLSTWIARRPENQALHATGIAQGWLQEIDRNLHAPNERLGDFLAHVIAGLSGDRKAALASSGGFCVGHTGYSHAEADALCVAAADFSEFVRRQRMRGWTEISGLASFHDDVAMLIPNVSFVPFWVDAVDYCLVLGSEPLTNNIAMVELIWSIKSSALRFRTA